MFQAIQSEFYNSKEWAKSNGWHWKEMIDGTQATQLCWKIMREILTKETGTFEEKEILAIERWRAIVKNAFQ